MRTIGSSSKVCLILGIGGLAWLSPVAVAAQEPASPVGLHSQALPTVFVRDDVGAETKGKLLALDAESVVLLVHGREQKFDLGKVQRIQKRGDSLKNGAMIGSAIGFGIGFLSASLADCRTSDGYGDCYAGARTAFVVASTAIYGLIGVGIDALIQRRTTLFERPLPRASLPASQTLGIRVAVRW